jgi:hypothetical protein
VIRRFSARRVAFNLPDAMSSGIALLAILEDGSMVEVATIGREGVVGTPAVLDGNSGNVVLMVQGESDTCYRMASDGFRSEMDRRPTSSDP